jgi:hypothetical protein
MEGQPRKMDFKIFNGEETCMVYCQMKSRLQTLSVQDGKKVQFYSTISITLNQKKNKKARKQKV